MCNLASLTDFYVFSAIAVQARFKGGKRLKVPYTTHGNMKSVSGDLPFIAKNVQLC